MDRRKFLKYAGTGAVAVGAGAAAYYLYNTGLRKGVEVSIPNVTGTESTASTRANHPPLANFTRKPFYLNPTDQQTIQFSSNCYDADNDPLQYAWSVDGEQKSSERDYSTVLPVGGHSIQLTVSDGVTQNRIQQALAVEPDQIYSTKPLHIKYKGMRYSAGNYTPEFGLPTPSLGEMDEQLDTIHSELGCNAIYIIAGGPYEDNLIECGKLAIEKGFERIYIQPTYMGATPDETVDRVGRFAPRVRALREESEAIVYCVGHEFGIETSIVRGDTWFDRADNLATDWGKVTAALPGLIAKIIKVCKENYGYKISYAAIVAEVDLVPWENPIFESVGVDAYVMPVVAWTEDRIIDLLSRLKQYRKPVFSMEAGCMTFKGAAYFGGVVPHDVPARPYDEQEQADYIRRYCDMLNRARVDGYFYTQYNDNESDDNSSNKYYGLYNGRRRKKGFYMYKSCQRTL